MKGIPFFRIFITTAMVHLLFRNAATGEQSIMSLNQASVVIDTDSRSKPYDPMIFGGFLEHFDDQVYGGIFAPDSPLSDENGFRRDVIEALKELRIPIFRWPGGCFVSGCHWELGVGKNRQPTDDMAWGVIESNKFGTDEYVEFCRVMGWEPFICTNAPFLSSIRQFYSDK